MLKTTLFINQNLYAMKKKVLYFGGLLLVSTMLLVGCLKTKTVTVNKYFSVQNAALIEAAMPEATSTNNIDVSMNSNVIAGGSSVVSVNSLTGIRKVLVGVENEYGYYEVVPSRNTGLFTIIINQDIDLGEKETFPIAVAVVDSNGDISRIWITEVKLIAVGTGALQVSLSFDNAKDVDLHLIEPAYIDEYGDPVPFYSRHIYYGDKTSANGGILDLDSNPSCSIDNINNENITYDEIESTVVTGTYKVYVDLYENCEESIATNYVVTVFYGGRMIASRSGVFEVGAPSTYNPISESYVEEHEPFLTFNISQGHKGNGSFEPAPMTPSAMEKEARAMHN